MKQKNIKSFSALTRLAGVSSGTVNEFIKVKTDLGEFFSNPLFFETYHELDDE